MIDKTSEEVAKMLSVALISTIRVSRERGQDDFTKRDLQFFMSGVSGVLLLVNEYKTARIDKILDMMENNLVKLLEDNQK